MRIASIDIGSYSVRMAIADVKNGQIDIVLERGYITSLGSGVGETGKLKKDRIEETLKVLEEYKRDMERLKIDKVLAVATEAIRRAENAEGFIKKIKEKTGIEVKVISPQEEGRLAFLATAYSLKPKGEFLTVDQGGGSTEFIFGKDITLKDLISLPTGIVSLTEKFLEHDPPLEKEIKKLMGFLREEIEPLKKDIGEIIGLGGTITTLAALEYNVYPYDPRRIHGSELTLKSIRKWFDRLVKLPFKERSKRYRQVEDKRAKVIISGIAMFIVILESFEKEKLRVGNWGVKHGLIVREGYLKSRIKHGKVEGPALDFSL